MSYTQLSSRWVNIRKPRRCIMCLTKSDPPARMRYAAGIYEGEFSANYSCWICEHFMTPERWRECDNEISEGQIWDDPEYKPFRDKLTADMNNYDAFKAGTGLQDDDIFFIVPEEYKVKPHDPKYNYYWWCVELFQNSKFIGTKEQCFKNISDFPGHKIVDPSRKKW